MLYAPASGGGTRINSAADHSKIDSEIFTLNKKLTNEKCELGRRHRLRYCNWEYFA